MSLAEMKLEFIENPKSLLELFDLSILHMKENIPNNEDCQGISSLFRNENFETYVEYVNYHDFVCERKIDFRPIKNTITDELGFKFKIIVDGGIFYFVCYDSKYAINLEYYELADYKEFFNNLDELLTETKKYGKKIDSDFETSYTKKIEKESKSTFFYSKLTHLLIDELNKVMYGC